MIKIPKEGLKIWICRHTEYYPENTVLHTKPYSYCVGKVTGKCLWDSPDLGKPCDAKPYKIVPMEEK